MRLSRYLPALVVHEVRDRLQVVGSYASATCAASAPNVVDGESGRYLSVSKGIGDTMSETASPIDIKQAVPFGIEAALPYPTGIGYPNLLPEALGKRSPVIGRSLLSVSRSRRSTASRLLSFYHARREYMYLETAQTPLVPTFSASTLPCPDCNGVCLCSCVHAECGRWVCDGCWFDHEGVGCDEQETKRRAT